MNRGRSVMVRILVTFQNTWYNTKAYTKFTEHCPDPHSERPRGRKHVHPSQGSDASRCKRISKWRSCISTYTDTSHASSSINHDP